MYEQELLENQKKIGEIVRSYGKQPQEALEKLQALLKDTEGYAEADSPEYYSVVSSTNEAMGDLYMNMKNLPEAEKAFQEMLRGALKLYEADQEKFDYRMGGAQFKLGTFYRAFIGCHQFQPVPRKLNEQQQKVFEVAEKCYKNAIACTMENAKKGKGPYVELHSVSMEALMVLHAAVGNYETAVLFGQDAVRLGKAIYEKKDDRVQGFRLANQMGGLAGVYSFMKKPETALEYLEDANYVLETHEAEDAKTFGPMLARNYISLGGCYSAVDEEKENAEAAYKKGLERMIALNDQSNNRMVNDVIQSYIFVAEYYKKVENESEAKAHYTWAMKLASDMWKVTKQPVYENLVKQLQGKI